MAAPLDYALKDVGALRFDPENPRIPSRLRDRGEQEVVDYFLLDCNLIELMLSIGEQGYFSGEPLLVVPDEQGFVVVEGNRRLAALKVLSEMIVPTVMRGQVAKVLESTKHRPTKVPCIAYSERAEILNYLGYRHITGIKEWNALAKARYLKQLREKYDCSHQDAHKALAREIGSKAPTVAKLLTGLELLERAQDQGILNEIRLDEDDIAFSLLTTGIGWESIAHFIGLKSASDVEANELKDNEFSEFFHWVFDTRKGKSVLGESRNFSKLADIVQNETSLEALRSGETIEEAHLLSDGPVETLRTLIQASEKSLVSALNTVRFVEAVAENDIDNAARVKRAATNLLSNIRDVFEEDSEDD
mgnify:CR=1 FL=1